MTTRLEDRIKQIRDFPSLVDYLRSDLDWPLDVDHVEELAFDWEPEELGLNPEAAVGIQSIRQLRPLVGRQPWGIFYIEFEKKRLPVVLMRRILKSLTFKKKATADAADRPAWDANDLLFICATGEAGSRGMTFAHFEDAGERSARLKSFSWDQSETHFHYLHSLNLENLRWPVDTSDWGGWRAQWSSAFITEIRQTVRDSQELSRRMASLAVRTRDVVAALFDAEVESGALHRLFMSFRTLLIHDLEPAGFADMLAQTIAYGLFSARVTGDESLGLGHLEVMIPSTNPFLQELFSQLADLGGPGTEQIDFDELGVNDLVDLLNAMDVEAIIRDFGRQSRLGAEDPVIHFYEDFLHDYDPQQRAQRGVFYTPRPVVSFMVRSIDEILRTHYSLVDGLADTATWGEMVDRLGMALPPGVAADDAFVQILDPATGTGTFLVEVIDLVHRRLVETWSARGEKDRTIGALWNSYVTEHLLPRLYGFELLMAPYAIAHLKIGLKLHETGYDFGSGQRANVFLTNTLEAPRGLGEQLTMLDGAIAHEARSVDSVKSRAAFTIVLGNPPYSLQSQNLTDEARAIVGPYRSVDGKLIEERGALQFEKIIQDDYVKFFRHAETTVARTGVGLVGLIANHGFVDNPTLRGMRASLKSTFSAIWILDLHGNSTKREESPDGRADQNVFEIRQGVAVFFGARLSGDAKHTSNVGDIWGSRPEKYQLLSRSSLGEMSLEASLPKTPYYAFTVMDEEVESEYEAFLSLGALFSQRGMGIVTARDHIALAFDDGPLVETAREFRDSPLSDSAICEQLGIPLKKGWDVGRARASLQEVETLDGLVRTIDYRPFNRRRIFYHHSLVWGMSTPTMRHVSVGDNIGLATTRRVETGQFRHVLCSRNLVGHHFVALKEVSHFFPLWLAPPDDVLAGTTDRVPNLGREALRSFAECLGVEPIGPYGVPRGFTPEDVFNYAYAVLHSPLFRERYGSLLTRDIPRIPMPGAGTALFIDLAETGAKLVAHHCLEALPPRRNRADLIGSSEMPVEAVSHDGDAVWLDRKKTRGFSGVSSEVWSFHIGDYAVCEKWLRDRQPKGGKNPQPGRVLSEEDVSHFQSVVVAIDETLSLQGTIDDIVVKHGGWPQAFGR